MGGRCVTCVFHSWGISSGLNHLVFLFELNVAVASFCRHECLAGSFVATSWAYFSYFMVYEACPELDFIQRLPQKGVHTQTIQILQPPLYISTETSAKRTLLAHPPPSQTVKRVSQSSSIIHHKHHQFTLQNQNASILSIQSRIYPSTSSNSTYPCCHLQSDAASHIILDSILNNICHDL